MLTKIVREEKDYTLLNLGLVYGECVALLRMIDLIVSTSDWDKIEGIKAVKYVRDNIRGVKALGWLMVIPGEMAISDNAKRESLRRYIELLDEDLIQLRAILRKLAPTLIK